MTLASPPGLPLVEVALTQGAVLRVHAGCDAATLAMVLAALEGSRC
jgi:16S rRNA C1402 (ribose-2'-O) methylase RsmI